MIAGRGGQIHRLNHGDDARSKEGKQQESESCITTLNGSHGGNAHTDIAKGDAYAPPLERRYSAALLAALAAVKIALRSPFMIFSNREVTIM